jgi:hypothetical protein
LVPVQELPGIEVSLLVLVDDVLCFQNDLLGIIVKVELLDFLGLMDLPQINVQWYQREGQQFNLDDYSKQVILKAEDIIHKNQKRYFNAWEFLNGYQMMNQIGLIQTTKSKSYI